MEAHAPYRMIRSSFYTYGIRECDKWNILNLEVALFSSET